MNAPSESGRRTVRLAQPSIADIIAEELRERIVSGQLREGDMLPRQEELVQEFQVSRPPLREALRILEAEGLVTVLRGNKGGAIVHSPSKSGTSYSLGRLLQFERVPLSDLGSAVADLEAICARRAAELTDRNETLVPELERLLDAQAELVETETEFTRAGRAFHAAIMQGCGNETLQVLAGAMLGLWSSQEEDWADIVSSSRDYPAVESRQKVVNAHRRMVEAIRVGDADLADSMARAHAQASQLHIFARPDMVDRKVSLAREVLSTRGRIFDERQWPAGS